MFFLRIIVNRPFSNQLPRQCFSSEKGKMDSILKPPPEVYLMKNLNKSAFEKAIKIPVLNLGSIKISSVLPSVKKYFLKIENFKAIEHIDKDNVRVYLNPEIVMQWVDFPLEVRNNLENLNCTENNLKVEDFTLKYENYTAESIFRAVLPKDQEGVSSFTKVGHIVHINLREHLIPFKNIIGEVLYDKIKGCESVVNKVNMIDNTYRNFKMEVLKGSDNMHTTVKENNCRFEFDFSTVYWNSRLCTEHERIVKILKPNDIFFDVFAGVGPFSIPVAKKKCKVFANDLNPESFKWLVHNKNLNKISDEYFTGFNMDGKDFIFKVVKEHLPQYIENREIIIAMNLPAMAVEFLSCYVGLFNNDELTPNFKPITVFVYCFSKGENPEQIARDLIHENLKVEGVDIDSKISNIFRVRTVSSMKEMMRVTLKLDRDILVGKCSSKRKIENIDIGEVKKHCFDKNGEKQEEKQQCFQSSGSQEPKNESESQGSEK